MKISSVLCFCVCAGMLLAGCVSSNVSDRSMTEVATRPADPLALWVAEAPSPNIVACSVNRNAAPEAVARFEAVSTQIAKLYRQVYDDAHTVSSGASEAAISTDADASGWRDAAQSAVTAHYQTTLQAIEVQRKALLDCTETLRADNTLSNLTSRLERTLVLTGFGKDLSQLDEQLRAANEGAALIMRRRIAATLGK